MESILELLGYAVSDWVISCISAFHCTVYLLDVRVRQRHLVTIPALLTLRSVVRRQNLIIVPIPATCPLVWARWSVVLSGDTSGSAQITWKNLNVKYGPWLFKALESITKFDTQSWMKMIATVAAVLFAFVVAFVNFENLSVITAIS